MSEEEYTRLLKQFPAKLQGALTWKKYFERLVHAGRRTGRMDIEIGDDIRNELKGQLADSTVRTYLPSSFKHMEHASEHKEPPKFSGSQVNRRLVVAEEPTIPPLPEVHREAEIIREREPPKPIEEPIKTEHQNKIIEVVFDPAPIDRDRTQVFIIEIDIVTKKVKQYKTVGRRSVR